jgi:hypothetical protein
MVVLFHTFLLELSVVGGESRTTAARSFWLELVILCFEPEF